MKAFFSMILFFRPRERIGEAVEQVFRRHCPFDRLGDRPVVERSRNDILPSIGAASRRGFPHVERDARPFNMTRDLLPLIGAAFRPHFPFDRLRERNIPVVERSRNDLNKKIKIVLRFFSL